MANREKWLVSTEWLAEHLDSPDVVIIDGSWYLPDMERDALAEYQAAHIPGALFFDIDAIADLDTDLPHMLPEPVFFSSTMRKMGIGDGQKIVVYDGMGLFTAPRVWWTFRTFGVSDVFVLDGGLPKWLAEERPVSDMPVTRRERHFTARFDHGVVRDHADMCKAVETGSPQILDARPEGRWRGTELEPRPEVRSGRMPGSKNLFLWRSRR